MNRSRREWLALAAAAPMTALVQAQTASPSPSAAASWPRQPVRIIVPNVPGGALDILARLLEVELSKVWKQSVIVDYKPGAGTLTGTDYVAKSAPDGDS